MISCEHRSHANEGPATCGLIADLSGLPLRDCLVAEETCCNCLTCGDPPERPNAIVAVASIALAETLAPNRVEQVRKKLGRFTRKSEFLGDVATPENYPCTHRGQQRGVTESDLKRIRGEEFPIYECALHQVCQIGRRHSQIAHVCMGCDDRAEPPRDGQRVVVLDSDLHGFGDACLMAWASEGSRDAPVKLIHHATGLKRDFLVMLGQEVADNADDAVNTFDAYHSFECELERGSVPRILSRSRALGIRSVPQRPTVTIGDDAIAWARGIIEDGLKRSRTGKTILLFPQTVYMSREWPAAYWHELAWLLSQSGHSVMTCVWQDEPRWNGMLGGKLLAFPWDHWAAMLRLADLTVAVSSGPACLAGTLDVPTLVVEGPTRPTIWAHCPSVEVMRVSKDTMPCVNCHFGYPFRRTCDLGCQALMRLFPEHVHARVEEKLNEPRNRQFSDWPAVLARYESLAGGVRAGLLPGVGTAGLRA